MQCGLQKAFDLVNINILDEKHINVFNIHILLVKLVASFS